MNKRLPENNLVTLDYSIVALRSQSQSLGHTMKNFVFRNGLEILLMANFSSIQLRNLIATEVTKHEARQVLHAVQSFIITMQKT